MPNFNKGAFGQPVRVTFNRDVSTATLFSMELEPQFQGTRLGDGIPNLPAVLRVVPVLGTVDVEVDDQLLLANQYVEYVTKEGDLVDVGRWRTKAIATLPGETVATDFKFFQVLA